MIDSGLYTFDKDGLKVATTAEIFEYLKSELEHIITNNVNLEQNTPDGQILNIFTLAIKEMSDILQYNYNAINVNTAVGVNLDNLATLNGIRRNNGSFTIVPITVTINQNVSLQGLDDNLDLESGTGFTIGDNEGNNYILTRSVVLEYTPETAQYVLEFRAQYKGKNEPILNNIQNIITPQIGVISVSNESAPLVIGEEEESDYNLRKRFYLSYSNSGWGEFNQIIANIVDKVPNILSINGENNRSSFTSQYGTPPHSVWLIIEGGADQAIANAIYERLGTGTGMRGSVAVDIWDVYNNCETIRFERPTYEDLYVSFLITKKRPDYIVDEAKIKEDLINNLHLEINQMVDVSNIDTILTLANDSLIYSNILVSKDGTNWSSFVNNTSINYRFLLTADNIIITVG